MFRKFPGYDGSFDIKGINEKLNKNIKEIVEGSSIVSRNEKQIHNHLGVKDFDTRSVYVTDSNDVYRLEINIANLVDGGKIVYVKRFVEKAPKEIADKIKKAETTGKTHLNQPYSYSIPDTTKTVKEKFSLPETRPTTDSSMSCCLTGAFCKI